VAQRWARQLRQPPHWPPAPREPRLTKRRLAPGDSRLLQGEDKGPRLISLRAALSC
jgi:hypothetical protein